jgi:predicted acylesterase/phospholipase RssA
MSITATIRCKYGKTNKGIIIGGGGTRGVHALGLFMYLLEKNDILDISEIGIYGGTSTGSFFATGMSLGYTRDDIVSLSKEIPIDNITDPTYMLPKSLFRFLYNGYLYSSDGRASVAKMVIEKKLNILQRDLGDVTLGYSDITFAHLRQLIKGYPKIYKDLLINTVDISIGKQVFMTTMDCDSDNITLYDAMMASGTFPFLFDPFNLYYSDKKYSSIPAPEYNIHKMVDGGLAINNPLEYFVKNRLTDYTFWLVRFINETDYGEVNTPYKLAMQMFYYLLVGKSEIAEDILIDDNDLSIIDLDVTQGTFQAYTNEEVCKITLETYNKCKNGHIKIIHEDEM